MNVMIRRAEAGAEFLGGDPLVVVRGGGILLLAKQGGERGVLLGSALEAEHHVVHRQAIGREAAIEFCAGERMGGAEARDHLTFVDWSGDERTGLVGLCRRCERGDRNKSKECNQSGGNRVCGSHGFYEYL